VTLTPAELVFVRLCVRTEDWCRTRAFPKMSERTMGADTAFAIRGGRGKVAMYHVLRPRLRHLATVGLEEGDKPEGGEGGVV